MDELAAQFLNMYNTQVPWPTNPEIVNRELFLAANRTMRDWRGDPDTLIVALRQYVATGSQPYALAGAAKVLVSASYKHDDLNDEEGVAEAFRWFARAKALAPDDAEILLIEVGLRLTDKQPEIARALLDRIRSSGHDSFGYRLSEVNYYDDVKETDKALEMMDKARELATDRRDETYIWAIKSDTLMGHKRNQEAEQAYRKRLQLDPTDPWGWHNLSIVYQRLNLLDKAKEANEHALAIADFGAARNVQEIIRKKMEKAAAAGQQPAQAQQNFGVKKPLPDLPPSAKPKSAASPIAKDEPRGLFGFFRRKKS